MSTSLVAFVLLGALLLAAVYLVTAGARLTRLGTNVGLVGGILVSLCALAGLILVGVAMVRLVGEAL